MTKAEFVAKYAEKTGMSQKAAGEAVDAFFETVSDALQAGERIVMPGKLKIEKGIRAARTGKNPQTGEPVEIPEKTVIKAKFSDKLLYISPWTG